MNKRDIIEAQYPESKMKFIPNMDEAILGVDENPWTKLKDDNDDSTERVIYSVRKLIQIFMERDSMDYDMAREHMDYNVMGGYVGVHTPVFAEDEDFED